MRAFFVVDGRVDAVDRAGCVERAAVYGYAVIDGFSNFFVHAKGFWLRGCLLLGKVLELLCGCACAEEG